MNLRSIVVFVIRVIVSATTTLTQTLGFACVAVLFLEALTGLSMAIFRLIPGFIDHVHEHFESTDDLVLILLAKYLMVVLALGDLLPQFLFLITNFAIDLFKGFSLMDHLFLQTDDFTAMGILRTEPRQCHVLDPQYVPVGRSMLTGP